MKHFPTIGFFYFSLISRSDPNLHKNEIKTACAGATFFAPGGFLPHPPNIE